MAFNVSTGGALAVLFVILVFFTILALGAGGFLSFLPERLTLFCNLNKDGSDASADYFLSARNSAGSFAIAMSFFASGMGAWVVYGTTEMGANPQLSWLGVLGYSGASAFPAILISWLGPMIRRKTEGSVKAFSTTDFGRKRYGRVMQVSIAIISVFYMFIFIVAELTSISNVFALLTGNFNEGFGILVTVALGIFTILYTSISGLPASIVTDKFQGIIMGLLVLILTIAVTSLSENRVTPSEYARASNFTTQGLMAAVTLVIAIACAELFNQSTWQRVWAAEDERSLRRGFFLGSFLVFLLMMFFGIMGMIAYANDPEAYDSFEKLAFLSFFDILAPLQTGWHVVVLILVTALAASSIDSLQNGLTSIFYSDLCKIGWNPKLVTRVLLGLTNIPAIYMASKKFDVISLFLVADLTCATAVFPTFLGLQTEDKGILVAPTELGAFLGIISGIVTVLVNGVVNDAEGGIFDYFWLRNQGICALCGSKTMVTFIITPLISGVMTYVFSFLDVLARGESARAPLIHVPFDKDDNTESPDFQEVDEDGSDEYVKGKVTDDGDDNNKKDAGEVMDTAKDVEGGNATEANA